MIEITLHPDDRRILALFNRQAITRDEWTHAMHLRVGWIHVRLFGIDESSRRLRRCIRRLNDANGILNSESSGYHETLTRLWILLIEATDKGDETRANSSDAFLSDHPELIDPRLPLRYFSKQRLMSSTARKAWTEPDLNALPT